MLDIGITGESHSKEILIKMRGFGEADIDEQALADFMRRRHGDGSALAEACSTARREPDEVIISREEGVILAKIENKDVRSGDYDSIRTKLRPGHADLGAFLKYGAEGLKPGGGEFSGRMSAALCVSGGIAKQILEKRGVTISAAIDAIGGVNIAEAGTDAAIDAVKSATADGDSLGGIVSCRVSGYPGGIGGGWFEGLEGDLAYAMLGIPSAKGADFGSGINGSAMCGSQNNDEYFQEDGRIVTHTNNQGGISGGISTGMDITMRVYFKPVSSIAKPQRTVDISDMSETEISVGGRHDVCIVPRVLPVVEAAAAIVLLDRLLDDEEKSTIEELRAEIDAADRDILDAFARRMETSRAIAEYKRKYNLGVCDRQREEYKIKTVRGDAGEELSGYAEELQDKLAELSRRYQEEKNR